MSNIDRRVRHRNPFLFRNWRTATDSLSQMGSKFSSPSTRPGDKYHGGEDDGYRPVKRRRIHDDPVGFPLYKPLPKEQQSFRRHSKHMKGSPGQDDPLEREALQVDINKISHREGPRVKFNGVFNGTNPGALKDVSTVKARCIITIMAYESGEHVTIFLDSQICNIATFRSPLSSWPEARFDLDPFLVPREKLFVPRNDGQGFALADSYTLRVEFRPASDKWPPVDLVRRQEEEFCNGTLGENPKNSVLSATIADIYQHNQNRKPARLKIKNQHSTEITTDFVVEMEARWCSRISINATGRLEQADIMPSITVIGTNERLQQSPPQINGYANGGMNGAVVHAANGHMDGQVNGVHSPINGHSNGNYFNGVPASPTEEYEELTPNRSKRTRTDINYNVRQMWNTAVGKEPRKRRKNQHAIFPDHGHGITYILPMEQIQGDDFKCVLCGVVNHSTIQLRAHLENHPTYLFDFDESRKGSLQISVSHNPENPGSPLRPQVYQLGLPTKPFDFESYVAGDDSWITSRLGPDNGDDVSFVQLRAPGKPRSSVVVPRPVAAPRRASQKRTSPKKTIVPKSKHPLYDPVSKVQLEPGSEYRPPVADDTWIIQKHRDTLMDFLDVEPGEKEYMREWDGFILKKHLTTDKYLPRAFLTFVRMHASWITAKPQRAVEFGKHAAMLLARNAITESTFHDATVALNEARTKPSTNGTVPAEEPKTLSPRGPDRCTVCDQRVPMPAMLMCTNKKCKNRLYHKKCVPEEVERSQKWLCASCR